MRNGELDPDFIWEVRKERLSQAASAILSHVEAVGQAVAHKVGEFTTPFVLDVHDALNGSHLRDEYFAQKRALANQAMRELVEL